ncbi:uncharacterized protein LOC141607395 [Silene latifolia]|uniref:uncharacterized protein LOC141607395 n=1 Tax=Silene latifolia TaxID=37657 RepID=UPI003D788A32
MTTKQTSDLSWGCRSVALGLKLILPNCAWKHSTSGVYSVKSGYGIAVEDHLNKTCREKDLDRASRVCVAFCRKKLWKLPGPQMWKVLILRIITNSISNRTTFMKRGINVDPYCRFCYGNDFLETVNHLFRDCAVVTRNWAASSLGIRSRNDSHVDIGDWIVNWINYLSDIDNGDRLIIHFLAIIWSIWCNRKNLVFRDCKFSPAAFFKMQSRIAADAITATESSLGRPRLDDYSVHLPFNEVREKVKECIPIYPIATGHGCNTIRVKVDAGWRNSLRSAAGWVAYDSAGTIIYEGGKGFWSESALQAEAKGIREALLWARTNGFHHLDVFSDCLQILFQIT